MTLSIQEIPGLQLFSSNRVEALSEMLMLSLSAKRLDSPFTREVIVVPSPAMGRWLDLELARQQGISANIHYPLPATWIWEVAHSVLDGLPQVDPLQQRPLAWQIFTLISELVNSKPFADLKRYLRNTADDLKQWQLSVRIAEVFDRYQFYRPKQILSWSQKPEQNWQAILWHRLVSPIPKGHRVVVIHRLLEALQTGKVAPDLPERVHLFALSSLPPLYIQAIHGLAQHTQIRLFLHSPTDQYWADLKSKKSFARLRVQRPEHATYVDTGHELLASWGLQGQILQDLLLSEEHLQSAQWEDYRAPSTHTLLGRVQNDIFSLQNETDPTPVDRTIQLHICHSALRECQVLHDQLLDLLQQNKSLAAENILVMVPEISRYAPYIEAVFRKDESGARTFLPWNLSDLTMVEEHPLIRIFFQLLDLPSSRFTATEIRSYLDVPELAAHFELDASATEDVRLLLELAGVRWGMHGQHKAELGLPATQENTWQQAEHRLFAGYALGTEECWQGIAPVVEVEGGKAVSLGRFWRLFERLQHYQQQLTQPHNGEQWQDLLNGMLNDFFGSQVDEAGRLQQIRDAFAEVGRYAGTPTLSPPLVRCYLTQTLSSEKRQGRYFSGGITFCGMRPMRSLPFQVICLLGMNDQAFPRRERPVEFDQMANTWQLGDPNKGMEDRYLMLETLLCARHTFYISYTGRDMKDNSEQQPSVLVREFLDHLDSSFLAEDSTEKRRAVLSTQITTVHPLQAFSPDNYQNQAPSFDRYWHQMAETLRQTPTTLQPESWPNTKLPPTTSVQDLELGRLLRFARHPVQFFYTTRLGIWLQTNSPGVDEEPFKLTPLEAWILKNQMAKDQLRNQPTRQMDLQARGLLPHGIFSKLCFDQIKNEVTPLLEKLNKYQGIPSITKPIAIQLANGISLRGQIRSFFPGKGLLHFSPSKRKGKALLSLWLEHLALCATQQMAANEQSTLLCGDSSTHFAPLSVDQARSELQCYIHHYQEGLLRPLPLFPLASYSYALQGGKNAGLRKAMAAWEGVSFRKILGDKEDAYIQLAHRGLIGHPIKAPEFATLAMDFFARALQYGETL